MLLSFNIFILCIFITARADLLIGGSKIHIKPELVERNVLHNSNYLLNDGVNQNTKNSSLFGEDNIRLGEVSFKLDNIHNMVYTFKLKVGQKKETYLMLLDTGSDWTWVNSHECQNCKNKRFTCDNDN